MHDAAKTAEMLRLWEAAVDEFHDPAGGIEIVIGPVHAHAHANVDRDRDMDMCMDMRMHMAYGHAWP